MGTQGRPFFTSIHDIRTQQNALFLGACGGTKTATRKTEGGGYSFSLEKGRIIHSP